jgi:hypothetical protein
MVERTDDSHLRAPSPGSNGMSGFALFRLVPLGLLVLGFLGPWGKGRLGCGGPEEVFAGWMILLLLVAFSAGVLAIPICALLLPWLLRLFLPRSRVVLWIYRVAVALMLLLVLGAWLGRDDAEKPDPLGVTWGVWVFLLAIFAAAVVELAAVLIAIRGSSRRSGRTLAPR